jgi:flagellar basal-body rod modification protein FlgD
MSTTTDSISSSSTTNTATSAAKSLTGGSAQELQDRFLTMLVAQMKNQDPLNPMDNSQVTSQMAQLSTVNGISQMNNTMNSVLSAFSGMQSLQSASLVGRNALVPGSELKLTNGLAQGGFVLDEDSTSTTMSILNKSGATVYTADLGQMSAGTHTVAWDGKLDNGQTLADGDYTLQVFTDVNGKNVKVQTLNPSTITAVQPDGAGVNVIDAAGNTHKLADVRQIS